MIAFADEYGNNSFKFDTQGTHFVIASVICKEEKITTLESQLKDIRQNHKFQTGELKSNKVGKNYERRKRILRDIAKMNCSFYAVIVDKRKLYGKGFKYKKSFYKYLNNLLYKELFRTFQKLKIYVDEHGGNDYMLEFKKYVKKNHQKDLFKGSDFDVLDSKSNSLIQLADFIAGTLGHCYDENKITEHSEEFLEIITPQISALNEFPKEYSFKEYSETNTDEEFDTIIAELCHRRINEFIENTSAVSQETSDQINFLKLLLLFQRVQYKSRFVSTKELFKHLNRNRKENMNTEYFRSKIVGKLRDKGILIASSRKGYKIPINRNDIESFIKHGNNMIIPMLNRISKVNEAIKLVSNNEMNILDNFPELNEILK